MRRKRAIVMPDEGIVIVRKTSLGQALRSASTERLPRGSVAAACFAPPRLDRPPRTPSTIQGLRMDSACACTLPLAVPKHGKYRRELCLNSLNS